MIEPHVSDEMPTGAEPWPRQVEPGADSVPSEDLSSEDLSSRWEASGGPRRPGGTPVLGGRRWLFRAAVLVVVVGLGFGSVWYYLQDRGHGQVLSAQRSAAAAARADALLVSDYDYRTLDQDFAAVQKASTPQFGSRFKQSITGNVQKLLVQYKASSKGQVQAVGVERVSGRTAVVLVDFDQTVSNSAAKPSTQQSRAELTLVRSGGRWLLSDLKLL